MPKLAEFDRCTGCTACAAACPKNCISMMPDADGFCHPVIDESSCVGCGLCEKVCPVLNPLELTHTPTAWAAWTGDDDSRMTSTSGGVFPEHLIRNFIALKRKDCLEMSKIPHPAEFEKYFNL